MVKKSQKLPSVIPERRYDCQFYGKCLTEAAILNDPDIPCLYCRRYEAREIEFMEDEFRWSELVRGLFDERGHEH